MITGFDHVVVAVRDIEGGVSAYETLLGEKAAPVFGEGSCADKVVSPCEMPIGIVADDAA